MKRLFAAIAILTLLSIPALFSQAVITSNITVLTGQQTATTTAANLGANTPIKSICVKALDGNAVALYVGGSNVSTANGMELIKDQSVCLNILNLNSVFIVTGSSTPAVSWIATK